MGLSLFRARGVNEVDAVGVIATKFDGCRISRLWTPERILIFDWNGEGEVIVVQGGGR